MVGRWVYTKERQYGDDVTYIAAARFLDGYGPVEDWGCGTSYARRFFQSSSYRGVDGSGPFADEIVDLTSYRSSGYNILLRHVLEHNVNWRVILNNAMESFEYRMVLVLFTPLAPETTILRINSRGIPDISFSRMELNELLQPFLVQEETMATKTEYGAECVLYLDKKPSGGF